MDDLDFLNKKRTKSNENSTNKIEQKLVPLRKISQFKANNEQDKYDA